MKTMIKTPRLKRGLYMTFLTFLLAGLMSACNKSSDPINGDDSASVSAESSEDSYHNDADDLANSAAAQSDVTLSGRTEKWGDNRLCTDTKITVQKLVNTDSDTLTIDFGTAGCTDAKGNVRKGKIVVIYSVGKRFALQSTHTITFVDFFVNGVKVEGARTVKNVSPNLDGDITFDITLAGGKLTFPDGTTATRETHHFRQWSRNGTPLDLSDDSQKILATYNGVNSTAGGTNRKGSSYSMQVTKDIVYKATCLSEKVFIPVSGTKVLTVTKNSNTVQITIDYGDGTCDKTVTITVNGKTATETIKRDSNG